MFNRFIIIKQLEATWVLFVCSISEQKIFELEHQLIANSEKLQSDGRSNIELRQQLSDMGMFTGSLS